MKPSAAILKIDFTVRNWVRTCYVIRIKKSEKKIENRKEERGPWERGCTRFRIPIGLKNIHSRERIQKVPDSPANSPDTCGRKMYAERKNCGLKKIRIRVDGA